MGQLFNAYKKNARAVFWTGLRWSNPEVTKTAVREESGVKNYLFLFIFAAHIALLPVTLTLLAGFNTFINYLRRKPLTEVQLTEGSHRLSRLRQLDLFELAYTLRNSNPRSDKSKQLTQTLEVIYKQNNDSLKEQLFRAAMTGYFNDPENNGKKTQVLIHQYLHKRGLRFVDETTVNKNPPLILEPNQAVDTKVILQIARLQTKHCIDFGRTTKSTQVENAFALFTINRSPENWLNLREALNSRRDGLLRATEYADALYNVDPTGDASQQFVL